MTKNKKLLFVVTFALFLVYTAGVIHITLRIGFDVLKVEPRLLDLGLIYLAVLAMIIPITTVVYLAMREGNEDKTIFMLNPPPLDTGDIDIEALRKKSYDELAKVWGIEPKYFDRSK